jgi:Carboxypeptidase regulatory-like domain/TonB dependent receptor
MKMQSLCPQRCFAVLVLAAIFLSVTSIAAKAQSAGAGTINGTVTDAAQAAIPGASVTVINTDTGITHDYTTNSTGLYTAAFLLPGHYKVDATAPNFGKVETRDITLIVGQTLTIDLTLKVSTSSTTVEVEAAPQMLDVEKTEVSQTMDQQMVQNLPVNARNWSSFVLLTPAVTQDGSSGLISFHGISGLYNQNYVDGANNNQMLFSEARGRASGAPYVYSVDSIKEFQAETSNYSVEFGQAAGGQVNAITKSGTSNLHGDLFYYLRYPDLNALDPYSKWNALFGSASSTPLLAKTLLTQPIHQQNQFGGSVGGPLIKDRLFYFFTYDGFRKVGRALYYNTNTITLTPTPSNAAGTIISPSQCPATITSTMCTAGIQFLINVGEAAPSRFAKQDLFFPRLDYHINSKNDAFVDFNFANFTSTNGYTATPTISNSSPTTNATTYYHERFLVGGLTTTINSSMVNQVHGQWGRDLETAGANDSGPSVSIGSSSGSLLLAFGMPNALPRIAEPDEHRIQGSDVFSWAKGRHTLKFGGDINNVHEVMINLFQGGGIYGYSDANNAAQFADWISDAFQGQAGNTDPYAGYHYNSFVQTVDQVNTKAGTQGKDDFYMNMYDVFAQDTWAVNRKLTVNIGARYDIQITPPPGKINNNYSPISNLYTQTIKNVADRVTPRIGFSYNLMPGTVIRGGYGIYTALNQGSTYYAMRVENGVVQVNYNYSGCKSSCTSSFAPSNTEQYPNVPFLPTGPALSTALVPSGGAVPAINGPSKLGSQSFHGLDPNFVPPYSHELDLSLEQLLPGKISLSMGYIGTRGLRLPVFVDSQLVGQTPHGIKSYNILDASGNLIKQMTVPVYLPTDRRYQNGATQNASTQLASFNTGFSVANTWYNALAATVRRPLANGLEFVGNYTWAHASDIGQVGGNNGTFYGGDVPLDPNNIKGENGQSDTDIRNRITLTFVYQTTFGIANQLGRAVVNGWSLSGSEIASGGQPVFLGVSGSSIYSGSTSASSYADDGGIYGGAMSSSTGSATNGRPPYIGRNSIPMPRWNNADLRLARKFAIHEGMSLDLSVDAFNFLNQTIVQGVNSNYGTYTAASSATAISLPSGAKELCSATPAAPSSSSLQGCFSPYAGTGATAFNQKSTTSSNLYGPRQLQVAAKFSF